jgi:hypothetical protein
MVTELLCTIFIVLAKLKYFDIKGFKGIGKFCPPAIEVFLNITPLSYLPYILVVGKAR